MRQDLSGGEKTAPHRQAYGRQAQDWCDRCTNPAGDAVDRLLDASSARRIVQFCSPIRLSGADNDVTAQRFDFGYLSLPTHQIDRMKAVRFGDLQHQSAYHRPSRRLYKPIAMTQFVLFKRKQPSRKRINHRLRCLRRLHYPEPVWHAQQDRPRALAMFQAR